MTADESDVFQVAESSARGGYYLFVGNSLSTVIMVIVSTLIARFLGPEDYAVYSLVISVPLMLIGLIDFGIISAITKFVVESKSAGKNSQVNRVIKSGIIFQLITGLIASAVCFVFSDFWATYMINTPDAASYIQTASLLVLFQTLFNGISSAFIGLDTMEKNAVMMGVRSVAKLLLSNLLILFFGLGILGAIVGHVLCYLVAICAGIVFLLYKLPKNDSSGSTLATLKSMLKYGLPLHGAHFLGLFSEYYQTVLLAFFVSKAPIGNFQVISLFFSGMAFLIYPLSALFPAFSKFAQNSTQLSNFFKRSVKYTALLLIPASVVMAVMSEDLVFTLFGTDYTLAPTFLTLYVLLYAYSGLGNAVFGYLFNGLGRTDITLKYTLIGLIVFIPFAPVLIYYYGIIGLILTVYIKGLSMIIYGLFMAIKKLDVKIDFVASAKILLSSIVSAIGCSTFLLYSPLSGVLNLFVGLAIFVMFYLTLLPIIGAINSTDLEIFRKLFHKTKTLWPIMKLLLGYEKKIMKVTKKC